MHTLLKRDQIVEMNRDIAMVSYYMLNVLYLKYISRQLSILGYVYFCSMDMIYRWIGR